MDMFLKGAEFNPRHKDFESQILAYYYNKINLSLKLRDIKKKIKKNKTKIFGWFLTDRKFEQNGDTGLMKKQM